MADKELFGNSEQLDDNISRQAEIDTGEFEINKEFYRRAKEEMIVLPETNQLEMNVV